MGKIIFCYIANKYNALARARYILVERISLALYFDNKIVWIFCDDFIGDSQSLFKVRTRVTIV